MGAEAIRSGRVIRVLLADDQSMIRTGLRMILDHEPDITTVGEVGDGAAAVAAARRELPDVVLMDIRMPGVDGIAATRAIQADPALVGVRVAVLTTFDDDGYVTGALRAGADAFLLKDTDPATLVACVHRVREGRSFLDPAVTALVLRQWRTSVRAVDGDRRWRRTMAGLTARELEVLRAVARGGVNADIAVELGLSTTTVKAHVHALLGKLGCAARAQLVVAAYEAGVIVPGAPPDGRPSG